MKKHRSFKRRYKKIAAAVAGAAIMSSAVLPGMASAAPHAQTRPSYVTTETTASHASAGPVAVVRENAATYGFNDGGSFKLEGQTSNKAIVRVRSDGRTYKVDLVRRGGEWVIETIRGIGDQNTPATYTPASMFPRAAALPVAGGTTIIPITLGAAQQVIHRTNAYDAWTWTRSTYPSDMSFGVLLRPGTAPAAVADAVTGIDFGRNFALFAHLGTVPGIGYGLGIVSVEKSGNDLNVTVKAKTPAPGETAVRTKSGEVLVIDRSFVNFAAPIRVTFMDVNKHVLAAYTLTP